MAGFLEGDGYFGFSNKKNLMVTAAQVNPEPLHRLQDLVGGYIYPKKVTNPRHSPALVWSTVAGRAAGIMMTVYALMSPYRQWQIRESLAGWRLKEDNKYKTHCPQGHEYAVDNTYLYRGSRQCIICREFYDKRRIRNWKTTGDTSRGAVLEWRDQ